MPHSFVKCCIHALWATKERRPSLSFSIEQLVYKKKYEELIDSGCPVRIINGMPDHVHCLFLLNPQKSIAEVIKQVKGSVSAWINEQALVPAKFAWQTGYAAYSVSESQETRVFNYIKNQKQHHKLKTWQQEFEEFMLLHGLNPFPGNLNRQNG